MPMQPRFGALTTKSRHSPAVSAQPSPRSHI